MQIFKIALSLAFVTTLISAAPTPAPTPAAKEPETNTFKVSDLGKFEGLGFKGRDVQAELIEARGKATYASLMSAILSAFNAIRTKATKREIDDSLSLLNSRDEAFDKRLTPAGIKAAISGLTTVYKGLQSNGWFKEAEEFKKVYGLESKREISASHPDLDILGL